MTYVSEESSFTLEPILRNFLTEALASPQKPKVAASLAQFCMLSWRDCFNLPSQRSLADNVSRIIVEQVTLAPCYWPFLQPESTFSDSSINPTKILIVTILRLLSLALRSYMPSTNLSK